jgi:hypothetical protein
MSVRQGLGKARVRRPAWYVWALISMVMAGGIALSATPASAADDYPLYGTTPVPVDDPGTPLVDEGRILATELTNLEAVSGSNQQQLVGGTFTGLTVRACGKPLPTTITFPLQTTNCGLGSGMAAISSTNFGVEIEALSVTFTVKDTTSGSGLTLATATFVAGSGVSANGKSFTGTTGANGLLVSPALTANNVSGAVIVEAKGTLPNGESKTATFVLTIKAGAAVGLKLATTVATNQTTPIGNKFPTDLAVVAVDANGNAAGAGTSVTFVAPAGGATASLGTPPSGSTITVVTDDTGKANVPATAINAIGTYPR